MHTEVRCKNVLPAGRPGGRRRDGASAVTNGEMYSLTGRFCYPSNGGAREQQRRQEWSSSCSQHHHRSISVAARPYPGRTDAMAGGTVFTSEGTYYI